MRIVVVDLDGTIGKKRDGDWDYTKTEPMPSAIAAVNALRDQGATIIIHTARTWADAQISADWLAEQGVTFAGLQLNKPRGDVYFDDMSYPEVDKGIFEDLNFQSPCHRCSLHGGTLPEFKHTCFFCGLTADMAVCPTCGHDICPNCGNCLCTVPLASVLTVKRIHRKYCCDLAQFAGDKGRIIIPGFVHTQVVLNAEKALTTCAFAEGYMA